MEHLECGCLEVKAVDEATALVEQHISPSEPDPKQELNRKEAQERALDVIECYQKQIAEHLVGQALENCSSQVCEAVQELIAAHNRDMNRASETNKELRFELEKSMRALHDLTRQFHELMRNPFPSRANLEGSKSNEENATISAIISADPAKMGEASRTSSPGSHTPPSPDAIEGQGTAATLSEMTSRALKGTDSMVSKLFSPEELQGAQSFADDLLVNHTKGQAMAQILLEDRKHLKESIEKLQNELQATTEENTQYRQELAMLKITTVPLEEHKMILQARDTAIYELDVIKRKVTKLEEDLEKMRASSHPIGHSPENVMDAMPNVSKEVLEVVALLLRKDDTEHDEKDAKSFTPHEWLWDAAVRELDERADLAMKHGATENRLQELQARLEHLSKENDRLQSIVSDLENANEALQLDAQAFVYRNTVLSEQVASLLVKVEHLRRPLACDDKVLKDGSVDSRYCTFSKNERVHRKDAAEAASIASRVVQQRLARDGTSGLVVSPPACWQSSGSPIENVILVSPFNAAKKASCQKPHPSDGSTSLTACLPGTSRSRAIAMPVQNPRTFPQEADRGGRPSWQAISLDIPFGPLADEEVRKAFCSLPAKIRIERGLQRSINTFSLPPFSRIDRPTSHITLRNLGGTQTAPITKCSAGRLPSCDQLSGVALGRPSSHLILDCHNGEFNQQGATGGLDSGPNNGHSCSFSTSPPSKQLIPSMREEPRGSEPVPPGVAFSSQAAELSTDHGDLVSMLSLLDADESLDRYCVNTVSELVVRNQELLKELYIVTQKANAAEGQLADFLASMDGRCVGKKLTITEEKRRMLLSASGPSVVQSTQQGPCSASNVTAVTTKHVPTQAIPDMTTVKYVSNLSRKRLRQDENVVPHSPHRSFSPLCRSHPMLTEFSPVLTNHDPTSPLPMPDTDRAPPVDHAPPVAPHTGENSGHSIHHTADARHQCSAMENSIKALIQTVLDHQHACSARLDEGLAASLLRVLEAQNTVISCLDNTNVFDAENENKGSSLVEGAVFEPLVKVCAIQAEMLTQQANELFKVHQEAHDTLHKALCEDSQQLLRKTLEELKETLSDMTRKLQPPRLFSPPSTLPERAKPPREVEVKQVTSLSSDRLAEMPGLEEGTLLGRVEQLLQIALDKEDTILRACQASQRRQRHFIALKERKIQRLRRNIKKKLLMQQQISSSVAQSNLLSLSPTMTGINCGVQSLSKAVLCSDAKVGGATATPTPTLPFIKAISPARNLPLSTATKSLSPGDPDITKDGTHGLWVDEKAEAPFGAPRTDDAREGSNEDSESNSDEDSLSEMDNAAYADLRDQLAQTQVKLAQLTEELDMERASHVELSACMWRLEAERDDALEARRTIEDRIASMWTREQYESMVAELDRTRAGIEDRDAQLALAYEEKNKLRVELELYRQRYRAFVEEKEASAREYDLQLANQERRNGQLLQECTQHESRIVNLVKEVEAYDGILADMRKHNTELEQQLTKVKHTLLSEDRTQAILLDLYPGDALLQAHTELVHTLREEHDGLEARVQVLYTDLVQTREELLRKDTALRQAVQKGQKAERRLQEALYFIAQKGFEVPHHIEVRAEEESTAREQSLDVESEQAEDEDILFSSKARIQELQGYVEAQKLEIERLQRSESAWKLREEALRAQLAAMSRDPISKAVRRYGLSAVENFESMMAEMQKRVVALEAQLDVCTTKAVELEAALERAEADRTTTKLYIEELEKRMESTMTERNALEREKEELKATVEAQAVSLLQVQKELSQLKEDSRSMERSLEECVSVRDKLNADNCTLLEEVEKLVRVLEQAQAEKRSALTQNARAARALGQSAMSYHPRVSAAQALQARAQSANNTIS